MHSYQGKECKIHHNGDYSGDVVITRDGAAHLEVPFEDLLGLVAEYVRSRKLSQLEDADTEELFGLPAQHR